jgi:hypothetical protein
VRLLPVRRWLPWETVDPLRDGRRCPDCGSTVHGRGARKDHRDWHIARTEWDTKITQVIARLARHGGLTVAFEEGEDAPEGRYDPEEDDEDEDYR